MCLIIDNDVVHRVLDVSNDKDFSKVHEALFTNRGPYVRIAYGGQLATEYFVSDRIRRHILTLDRAGKAFAISETLVKAEEEKIKALGGMRSNDIHIVALARASGVRLLCTNDGQLQSDFTNSKLLQPRGKVYKKPNHGHLLMVCCGPKTRKS